MKRILYQELARTLRARQNCADSNNKEWEYKHAVRIHELVAKYMPRGSGFDNDTVLDCKASTPERLVFCTQFHHMNGCGFYDGWTEHKVIVVPSLQFDFDLRITGRDKRDIKEYIHEIFDAALRSEWDE